MRSVVLTCYLTWKTSEQCVKRMAHNQEHAMDGAVDRKYACMINVAMSATRKFYTNNDVNNGTIIIYQCNVEEQRTARATSHLSRFYFINCNAWS